MPTQKILKIAGAVLLAFIIFYAGLMTVLGGFTKTAFKSFPEISGNLAVSQSAISAMDSAAGAPSSRSKTYIAGEMVKDFNESGANFAPSPAAPAVDKKIIKTGNLNLKVEKAVTAAESITNIARLNKGEVSNSNFYESGRGTKAGYLTVRVPYQSFDAVFAEIKKVATQVISESSNASDITEEFTDLEARLKNKRAEEVSFVALLNRSGKIEEILAVTREVARVRGEIEQLEGKIRFLSSQTDMSTITVNLSEDVVIAEASEDWRPWQIVKASAKQLITNGQNFVNGLIGFIIVVLPTLIIYALIVWLIYYFGRKVYRHYANK